MFTIAQDMSKYNHLIITRLSFLEWLGNGLRTLNTLSQVTGYPNYRVSMDKILSNNLGTAVESENQKLIYLNTGLFSVEFSNLIVSYLMRRTTPNPTISPIFRHFWSGIQIMTWILDQVPKIVWFLDWNSRHSLNTDH